MFGIDWILLWSKNISGYYFSFFNVSITLGYSAWMLLFQWATLRLSTCSPYLDYKMREICQRTQPDIILTGSQSGTPYQVQEHSTHCLSSLALKPDACILVVNSIDAEEYIRDTIDGIRAVCKAPTILLAMGDHEKHIRTAYGRSMITPKKMAQSQIDQHLKKLQDTFCVPAIEILSETGQQRLVETVIQYFSVGATLVVAR